MGDTLSQEEIDNLLSALSTGEINPDELDEADVKSVRNYNFARPSKFSKDHCGLWRLYLKITADCFRRIYRHICVRQCRLM